MVQEAATTGGRGSGVRAEVGRESRVARWMLTAWLLAAVPLGRSSAAAAPVPAFEAPVSNPFGLSSATAHAAPAFADIDGDGDLDLLVGQQDGKTLFFSNSGTATSPAFIQGPNNPFQLNVVDGDAGIAFVDIDGDGDLDVFKGGYTGVVQFFRNTGTATSPAFATPVANPMGISTAFAFAKPSFADIDGDGDYDAMVGSGNGETFVFMNTGTATSPAFLILSLSPFGLTSVGNVAVPAFIDLDGDGDFDALLGAYDGSTVFFRNTGTRLSPAFAAASSGAFGIANVGNFAAPAWADLDGDGDLDVLIGNAAGTLQFFRNSQGAPAPAMFSPPVRDPSGLAGVPSRATVAVADLDADGDLDALMGDAAGESVFFANTGNAATAAFAPGSSGAFGLTDVGDDSAPALADIDADGDLDLLVGTATGSTVLFRNTGTARSPAFAAGSANALGLSSVPSSAKPAFADLDGDGDLDVIIGTNSGLVEFCQNTGTATSPAFGAANPNPFGISSVPAEAAPIFVDVDGDGDLDLVVGSGTGSLVFFRNTGSATSPAFAAPLSPAFGLRDVVSYAAPSFVDIDGDGDLDALIGGGDGHVQLSLGLILVFADGFESGGTGAWSITSP